MKIYVVSFAGIGSLTDSFDHTVIAVYKNHDKAFELYRDLNDNNQENPIVKTFRNSESFTCFKWDYEFKLTALEIKEEDD